MRGVGGAAVVGCLIASLLLFIEYLDRLQLLVLWYRALFVVTPPPGRVYVNKPV